MNKMYISLIILALLWKTPVHSQEKPPIAEATFFSAAEHPSLFPDLKVDGYESLKASIDIDTDAAKVSWAPLLYNSSYNFLNETRIQLSQKDEFDCFFLAVAI